MISRIRASSALTAKMRLGPVFCGAGAPKQAQSILFQEMRRVGYRSCNSVRLSCSAMDLLCGRSSIPCHCLNRKHRLNRHKLNKPTQALLLTSKSYILAATAFWNSTIFRSSNFRFVAYLGPLPLNNVNGDKHSLSAARNQTDNLVCLLYEVECIIITLYRETPTSLYMDVYLSLSAFHLHTPLFPLRLIFHKKHKILRHYWCDVSPAAKRWTKITPTWAHFLVFTGYTTLIFSYVNVSGEIERKLKVNHFDADRRHLKPVDINIYSTWTKSVWKHLTA